MMTEEAFRMYFRKLKPGGFLVTNISNLYLNLGQVMAANARDVGAAIIFRTTQGGIVQPEMLYVTNADFAVLAENKESLEPLFARDWGYYPGLGWNPAEDARGKGWCDDYSDIAGALSLWQ
jgi:spermidine synthase